MSICFVWWNIMLFATTSLKLYDWVWKENFFINITYLSIVSGGTLHVCSAVFVILLVYSICINSTKWMLRDCCDNAWMRGKIWNFKPLPAKIIRHNETHIIRLLETLLDKDIRKKKCGGTSRTSSPVHEKQNKSLTTFISTNIGRCNTVMHFSHETFFLRHVIHCRWLRVWQYLFIQSHSELSTVATCSQELRVALAFSIKQCQADTGRTALS